ncbi:DUF3108 domain-containing protein [Methylobacterium brachythecii]|uniref:DUF3108 domain-containing protein n=1 Tax=Methylobacterium brachythecii TaxID=1176177 RepID=A0A7W6ADF9_9HYPH|nr:DUF3108 domain-containing protein [Methylobacterium brachythecii]MBB3901210.1 hypothetical protein [Methylobacterium brachythecii]GLS44607.1 hypothetical protein GCM10007884_25950 [Methylobacterium brachythecii]
MAWRLSSLAGALLLASSLAADAAPRSFVIDYGLSFLGLTVGTSKLTAERNAEHYSLELDGGLAGMAGWFFQGGGKAGSSGRMSKSGTVPSSFKIDAHYSDYPVTVAVAFNDGTVKSAAVDPMPTPRPDRLPVAAGDKVGVTDPVGMLAIPAPSGPLEPSICDRRIPVYDGLTRVDIVLSRGSVSTLTKGPYRGPVLECRARWVPVSGHRPKGSSVKRMQENDDMRIRLAPAPEVGLLLPLSISVGLTWGTAKIDATRWGEAAPTPKPGKGAKASAQP